MSEPDWHGRFCNDCRHSYEQNQTAWHGGRETIAIRCAVKVPEPIMGQMGNPDVTTARLHEFFCGQAARWFEPK